MTVATRQPKEIAAIIIQQLGGNRFIAMTGAKNFLHDETGALSFTLPINGNTKRINVVKISLNDLDLYDMEFTTVRMGHFRKMVWVESKITTVENMTNVHVDLLRRNFTLATGLDTHL